MTSSATLALGLFAALLLTSRSARPDTWLEQLHAADPETRLAASFDSASLPQAPEARLAAIRAALRDEDPWVRRSGLAAAGELAISDASTIQALVDGLADRDRYVASHAVVALAKIGKPAFGSVLARIGATEEAPEGTALPAPPGHPAQRRAQVGDLALAALSLMGPAVLDLVDQSIQATVAPSTAGTGEKAAERERLLLVVRQMGPAAVPLLQRWSTGPTPSLRNWAADALLRLGDPWDQEIPWPAEANPLLVQVGSKETAVRSQALLELRKLALSRPPLAARVSKVMVQTLLTGDDADSELAVRTLAQLGAPGLRAAMKALDDENPRTAGRLASLIASAWLENEEATKAFKELATAALESQSSELRDAAKKQMGRLSGETTDTSDEPSDAGDPCASADQVTADLPFPEFRIRVGRLLEDCSSRGLQLLFARAQREPASSVDVYRIAEAAPSALVACAFRIVPPSQAPANSAIRRQLTQRVEELRARLRGGSSKDRQGAASCLGEAGSWGVSALDDLGALVRQDPDEATAIAAAGAFARIAIASGSLRAVYSLNSSPRPAVRAIAIEALAEQAGRVPDPTPALQAAAIDSAVASAITRLVTGILRDVGALRGGEDRQISSTLPQIGSIPRWSLSDVLRPQGSETLGAVYVRLKNALQASGFSYGLFATGDRQEDGFALVTRLERLEPDGRSMRGPDRWHTGNMPLSGWKDLLGRLFLAPPGYFRSFIFLVTPDSNIRIDASPSEISETAWKGGTELPDSLKRMSAKGWFLHVLIYHDEKKLGAFRLIENSPIPTAAEHLKRAGLTALLTSP